MLEFPFAMLNVGSWRAGGIASDTQSRRDLGKTIVNVPRFESGSSGSKLKLP